MSIFELPVMIMVIFEMPVMIMVIFDMPAMFMMIFEMPVMLYRMCGILEKNKRNTKLVICREQKPKLTAKVATLP